MIYVKIDNDNIVIDALNSDAEGYIAIEQYDWPFDIVNPDGILCYKYVDGHVTQRTDNEMYSYDTTDVIDEDEEQESGDIHTIEERISALEECMDVLLNGI